MRQAFLPAIVWDINTDSPSIFDQKLTKKKLILSRRLHGKCFDIQMLWYPFDIQMFVSKNTPKNSGSCCCCSVAQLCFTLSNPMNGGTPGFPVLHYLTEFAETHVHQIDDAIQLSHPMSSPALNLSHVSFQWNQLFTSVGQSTGASASASVLQWIFRDDFL